MWARIRDLMFCIPTTGLDNRDNREPIRNYE